MYHGSLVKYVKLQVVHAPGMPGTFPPPPRVDDPDMRTIIQTNHDLVDWRKHASLGLNELMPVRLRTWYKCISMKISRNVSAYSEKQWNVIMHLTSSELPLKAGHVGYIISYGIMWMHTCTSLTIKKTMLVKREKYVLIDHINMFSW